MISRDGQSNKAYVILEENEKPEIRSILDNGLKVFNESQIGTYQHEPFMLHITEGKTIIAGCYGDITRNNCYVDCIWVDSNHRKKGVAKTLMTKLEAYAGGKKCLVITIETADFQAQDFYTKIGFIVVAEYPHNTFLDHKVYLMRKRIHEQTNNDLNYKSDIFADD
ncbi:MAG: GNAT family N-acetyltransferase [Proteobacteria bacterium]|nr:GNAT family N-acetyltransferase [Pseudomonadota bacterium]